MLAGKLAAVDAKVAPVPERPAGGRVVLLSAALAAFGGVGWLYLGNPRLWGAWHGFLHSAIATRFSEAVFPPENPFFAGELLPYYWVYHFAGYWLSRVSRLDLLHTFHAISWISLMAFVLIAGWIGRARFRSTAAGLAVAWLGLAGLNPLGPAIAASKHWFRDVPLVRPAPAAVETTFVTNEAADDLMTEPLLPAMYVGADWRRGQNVVWFFDVGSRAPALAGLALIAWLLLEPGGGRGRRFAIGAVSAVVTALNPLVGLGACGALTAASVLTRSGVGWILTASASLAGAVAALPTYYQIFVRSGGSNASFHLSPALPVIVIAVNFLLLLPLSIGGGWKGGKRVATFTLAGALLLIGAMAVRLPEGNEHNLINAAQCLLAIPAGAVITSRRAFAAVLLTFLPVTACALIAYTARPPIPLGTRGGVLIRTPADGNLQQLYEWMRRDTAPRSIIIMDPDSPVKMSGNVSELPAFTGRTLFTDMPSYLTTPNRDAGLRQRIARRVVAGDELTHEERAYFRQFDRPIYVVSFRPDVEASLASFYGAAVFRGRGVAVFAIERGRRVE